MLARAGHRVTLASRHPLPFPPPSDVVDQIGFCTLELGTAAWDSLVEDVDVVHHYAWGSIPASANSNPGGDLRINVTSSIDLLDALRRRGGGRVVFASSGGTVYGKVKETPVSEEHPMSPITAYGAGKVAAEIYLGLYRSMYGLDCRIARIANPYGAGQDIERGVGAVTTFLHHALNGLPITIWGTGEAVRDYIHISDLANCLVTLADAPRNDTYIFNVASGVGISLNQIVLELEARLGCVLNVSRTETRAFDVPVSVLDISRANAVLGWAPRLSFSEGIALTLEDLRKKVHFSTLRWGSW
ncbi:NAD-dependent epimerase/dehydratase family protein [Acidisoma cellulosilytica]|uniref:NAD-dependent epimerase/dehydratase family protein n=2 Tax=Acidisoma cellulosilyticum TaxID=2802395 RepID=A0A963Z8Q4_9PROT|nr:NAD-dependent epimerase/dehydratase family protein [Acidisoma cellulosilyticum]